ncbi:unnamed protein product [Arabidopsis lyrata]|nr:unnamed protein product [Arabidopsis lyrata]
MLFASYRGGFGEGFELSPSLRSGKVCLKETGINVPQGRWCRWSRRSRYSLFVWFLFFSLLMCFIGLKHRRLGPSFFFGSERHRLSSRWLEVPNLRVVAECSFGFLILQIADGYVHPPDWVSSGFARILVWSSSSHGQQDPLSGSLSLVYCDLGLKELSKFVHHPSSNSLSGAAIRSSLSRQFHCSHVWAYLGLSICGSPCFRRL